jgi:hypothetical protein
MVQLTHTTTLGWLEGRDLIPTISWDDPVAGVGFDPTGSYVETYWLPILGPSSTWALRRIAGWLAGAGPSGVWLPVDPLARSLGLGGGAARNAPGRRAIARLVDFRLAVIDYEHGLLAVRRAIPMLTERAVDRLPGHLAAQHRIDYPIGSAPTAGVDHEAERLRSCPA